MRLPVALAEMVAAANRVHVRHAPRFNGLPPKVTSAHVRDLFADLRDAARQDGPAREALYRTRTDDPFLTMEVLYQLS